MSLSTILFDDITMNSFATSLAARGGFVTNGRAMT